MSQRRVRTESTADALAREHPEWRSFLELLAVTRAAVNDHTWLDGVPDAPAAVADGAPLLTGSTLPALERVVRNWVGRLLLTARRSGAVTLGPAQPPATDLVVAALNEDEEAVAALAARCGADAGALRVLAPLAAMPLLHACRTRWQAHVSASWTKPYCPVCGGWPTLAEVRGLDRTRRYRCGRCGGDWLATWLSCPYCDNRDHKTLGSLIPGAGSEARKVETCAACHGYVKSLAKLTPTPADEIVLEDLACVDLDLAAIERGFRRPPGPGHRLGARADASATRPRRRERPGGGPQRPELSDHGR